MHCLFILFPATIVPVRQAVKNYQFWQHEFLQENKNHCPGREQLSSECKSPCSNEALAARGFHDKMGSLLLVRWFLAPGTSAGLGLSFASLLLYNECKRISTLTSELKQGKCTPSERIARKKKGEKDEKKEREKVRKRRKKRKSLNRPSSVTS